jgi:hypothetical protein
LNWARIGTACSWRRGRRGHRFGLRQQLLGEQQQLPGIASVGTRPEARLQQPLQPVLQLAVAALRLVQSFVPLLD